MLTFANSISKDQLHSISKDQLHSISKDQLHSIIHTEKHEKQLYNQSTCYENMVDLLVKACPWLSVSERRVHHYALFSNILSKISTKKQNSVRSTTASNAACTKARVHTASRHLCGSEERYRAQRRTKI